MIMMGLVCAVCVFIAPLLDSGIDSKVLVMKNTMHNKEEYEYGYLKTELVKSIKVITHVRTRNTSRNKIMKLSKQNNRATYSLLHFKY